MGEILKEDKLDAIVCVAGGWAGGNAASAGNYKPTAAAYTHCILCRLGEKL